MSSIQSTENNRQEYAAFDIETKIESKEDEDKDKADDEREKEVPAIGLPRNEPASRLDTSINSHNTNSSDDTKVDDAIESDSDGFDSQHAVEFHSNYIKPNMREASHTTIQESSTIGVE